MGGGLQSTQEDLFAFSLSDGFVAGGTIDLSQFAFKFQGGAASYEKAGVPETPIPPTQVVPAPAALTLLGAGFVAFMIAGKLVTRRGR